MSLPLQFVPIDLARYGDFCVQFRRDSYVCSFGDDGQFDRENGADGAGYLTWLGQRMAELPEGCVHVWQGGRIIGQLEMRLRGVGNARVGYVNLFYLVPDERGKGHGPGLHEYAAQLFRRLGVSKLQLSVSPRNGRAMRFYEKCGWTDLGPRADHPDVHLMEFALARTD